MEDKKVELNCLKCQYRHPDNGNCTAVGGFCTAVPAAYCPLIPELLARAETAEAKNKGLLKELKSYSETELAKAHEKLSADWAKQKNRAEAAEARAEKAERERDTAVSDLETIMVYESLDTCQFCKNGQCHIRGGTKPCLPKWRGIKEE